MITLITVSYNSKEAITTCQAPVLDHKNFHSIIVDNASSDGSADVLQTRFPRSDVIKLPNNIVDPEKP